MVSKRGKRKRSTDVAAQGEQKRKRATEETSGDTLEVQSSSTGDENPGEQAHGYEDNSYTEPQETSDDIDQSTTTSTEYPSTHVSSQSADKDDQLSETRGEDGDDASPAVKVDTYSCTSSASGEVAEDSVVSEPQPDKPELSQGEAPTKEDGSNSEFAESSSKTEEEKSAEETLLDNDENVDDNSRKTTETFIDENQTKTDDHSSKTVDESQQTSPNDSQEFKPDEDSVSPSPADQNKSPSETLNSVSSECPRQEKHDDKDGEETGKEIESVAPPSLQLEDSHTEITLNKSTEKELGIDQQAEESVQNGTNDRSTDQPDQTEMDASTKTEPKLADSTEKQDLAIKSAPAECTKNEILTGFTRKLQIAQPNQAGDFVEAHIQDKTSPDAEPNPQTEKGKKGGGMVRETSTCELQTKEGAVEETLTGKSDGVDSVAAYGEELAGQLDPSGSQAFQDDGNAFDMDVTESQLCAVSDDILADGEADDVESRRQQQQQQQRDGEKLIQSVLEGLLTLNQQINRTRQQMEAERRKLQNKRLLVKGTMHTVHR